ncbi:CocE/NonD family hydrolase [Nocardia sp. NPDC058058]|uniref:CocE/NonD family hydrolase n=1 Tax=Nocardia sp. NPDC058058 TaxID=3346317 RepID=UPI0036D9F7B5
MKSEQRASWLVRRAVLATAVSTTIAASIAAGALARAEDGFTGIDGGPYAAAWTAAVDGPQPFSAMSTDFSVPITMSDGKVLKADIYQPTVNGQVASGQRPVVLQLQGYGKATYNLLQTILKIPGVEDVLMPWLATLNFPGSGLDGITDFTRQLDAGLAQGAIQDWDLVKGGYTLVQVDIRGTGVSEGDWQIFGQRERQDASEVIDWITRQPWSDGNVATMGTSFTGITALGAADQAPPGLKAVFAFEPSTDVFNDIAGSGGAIGTAFLGPWLLAVNLLKMAPDVEAVMSGRFDAAQQLQWLRDRLADPATYLDVVANGYTALNTDQLGPKARALLDPDSPFRKGITIDLAEIDAPTFIADSWFDIFGANPTTAFEKLPLPAEQKKLIMGDGYHTGGGLAGFGHPGMPPRLDVLQRAWFDKWLKGIDNGIDKYSPLTLKQQGGGWTTGGVSLLRPEASYRRMYLNDRPSGTAPTSLYDGGLAEQPLQDGVRDLTVAPGLLSICGRDTARITAGVSAFVVGCTEDSRIWEANGLSFTSGPVTQAATLSGPISVHLNTVLDAIDGYWVATVNDVAPDGNSREISSGQLVTSLRAIDEANSAKSANGDYTRPAYYIDLDRRQTVVPGQAITLDVAMVPTEAVLQPGHRLRIDVYASNFPKGIPILPVLVDTQLKPQHLRLDPNEPSWVNIALNSDIPN